MTLRGSVARILSPPSIVYPTNEPHEPPHDNSTPDLSGTVRSTWHRFLDVYEPLRPDLYRYCRYLTRSAWDAEDLAQDTLARAFVTVGLPVQGAAAESEGLAVSRRVESLDRSHASVARSRWRDPRGSRGAGAAGR